MSPPGTRANEFRRVHADGPKGCLRADVGLLVTTWVEMSYNSVDKKSRSRWGQPLGNEWYVPRNTKSESTTLELIEALVDRVHKPRCIN